MFPSNGSSLEKAEPVREFAQLCMDIVGELQRMKQGVEAFSESLHKRSALVRPIVRRDFEKGTGMTPEMWLDFLTQSMGDFQSMVEPSRQLVEAYHHGSDAGTLKAELARAAAFFLEKAELTVKSVERFQQYLAQAPERVKSVPSGFVTEEERRRLVEESPEQARRIGMLAASLKEAETRVRALLA